MENPGHRPRLSGKSLTTLDFFHTARDPRRGCGPRDPETPIWIDYWQIRRQITQRPVELMSPSEDGFNIG